MNIEAPNPEEIGQLRTVLLIVLGVIIVTIPMVMVLIVAKLSAKKRSQPPAGILSEQEIASKTIPDSSGSSKSTSSGNES